MCTDDRMGAKAVAGMDGWIGGWVDDGTCG